LVFKTNAFGRSATSPLTFSQIANYSLPKLRNILD
jgi:hypothetical protein